MGQAASYLTWGSENSGTTFTRQMEKPTELPLFRELNDPYRNQYLHILQTEQSDNATAGLLRAEASHWVYLNSEAFDAVKQFSSEQKTQARTIFEKLKAQLDIVNWDQTNVETVNTLLDDLHILLIGGVLDKMGVEKATQFDLSNCYLTRFPQQLFTDKKYLTVWKSVTEFSLSQNNIPSLHMPNFLGHLTSIDLSFNLLSEVRLPAELSAPDDKSMKGILLDYNRLESLELPVTSSLWSLGLSNNLLKTFTYPKDSQFKLSNLDLDDNFLESLALDQMYHPIMATAYGNLLTKETLTYNPDCAAVVACPFSTDGLGWVDYTLINQKDMQQLAFEVAHFQSPPQWLLARLGQDATNEYLELIKPLDVFDPNCAPTLETRNQLNQTLDKINNFLAVRLAELDSFCNFNNCYLTRLTLVMRKMIQGALDGGFNVNKVVLTNNYFFGLELGEEFAKATEFNASHCPNLEYLTLSAHCANLKSLTAKNCIALYKVTFEGIDTPTQAQPLYVDLSRNPSLLSLRIPLFYQQIDLLELDGSQLSHLSVPSSTFLLPFDLLVEGCNLLPQGLDLPDWYGLQVYNKILLAQAPHKEFVYFVEYYQQHEQEILDTYKPIMSTERFDEFKKRLARLTQYDTDTTTIPVGFILDQRMYNADIVEAKSSPDGSVLDLRNSFVTSVTDISFYKVKTLYLDGNPIFSLDYSRTELGDVEALFLNNMPNLCRVNLQPFGVPHLTALEITNTPLASFPMPTSLKQLKYLDLRQNRLPYVYISKTQKYLTEDTVFLDGNEIAAEQDTVLPRGVFSESWIKTMLATQKPATPGKPFTAEPAAAYPPSITDAIDNLYEGMANLLKAIPPEAQVNDVNDQPPARHNDNLNAHYRSLCKHYQQQAQYEGTKQALLKAEVEHWVNLYPEALALANRFTPEQITQAQMVINQLKPLRSNPNWDKDTEKVANALLDILHIVLIGGVISKHVPGTLRLSGCYLTRFPQILFTGPQYQAFWKDIGWLTLSNNNLTSLQIPDSLGHLGLINVSHNLLVDLQLPKVLTTSSGSPNLNFSHNQLQSITLPETAAYCTLDLSHNQLEAFSYAKDTPFKAESINLDNNRLTSFKLETVEYPSEVRAAGNYLSKESLVANPVCPAIAEPPFPTYGMDWIEYTLFNQEDMLQLAVEINHFINHPYWLRERLGQDASNQLDQLIIPLKAFDPRCAPTAQERSTLDDALNAINDFLAEKLVYIDEQNDTYKLSNCYLTRLTETTLTQMSEVIKTWGNDSIIDLSQNQFFELVLGEAFSTAPYVHVRNCHYLKSIQITEHLPILEQLYTDFCTRLQSVTFPPMDAPTKLKGVGFLSLLCTPSLEALVVPEYMQHIWQLNCSNSGLSSIHLPSKLQVAGLKLSQCQFLDSYSMGLPDSFSDKDKSKILKEQMPFIEYQTLIKYFNHNKQAIKDLYEKLMDEQTFGWLKGVLDELCAFDPNSERVPLIFYSYQNYYNRALIQAKTKAGSEELDLTDSFVTSLYDFATSDDVKTLVVVNSPMFSVNFYSPAFRNISQLQLEGMPNLRHVDLSTPYPSPLVNINISNTTLWEIRLPSRYVPLTDLTLYDNELLTIDLASAPSLDQSRVNVEKNFFRKASQLVLPWRGFSQDWIKRMIENQKESMDQPEPIAPSAQPLYTPAFDNQRASIEALCSATAELSIEKRDDKLKLAGRI